MQYNAGENRTFPRGCTYIFPRGFLNIMYSGKSLKVLIIRRRVSAEAKPSEVLDYCGTRYACVLYYKAYF